MSKSKRETADIRPAETATNDARERGVILPVETRVRVKRAWPGVHRGAFVSLHPEHTKRLLKDGFVEVVSV